MKCEQIITKSQRLHDLEECVKFYKRDSKKNTWKGFNKYGEVLVSDVPDINVFIWLANNSVEFVDKIEFEEKKLWPQIYISATHGFVFKRNKDETVDTFDINTGIIRTWEKHENWENTNKVLGKHRKLLLRLFEDIVE